MSDPVITWLEEIRDFEGTTDRSREMAQRAIERLAPATKAIGDDKVDRIVDAAAAENERAGKSVADEKIERIQQAAIDETERGRAARRKP